MFDACPGPGHEPEGRAPARLVAKVRWNLAELVLGAPVFGGGGRATDYSPP